MDGMFFDPKNLWLPSRLYHQGLVQKVRVKNLTTNFSNEAAPKLFHTSYTITSKSGTKCFWKVSRHELTTLIVVGRNTKTVHIVVSITVTFFFH